MFSSIGAAGMSAESPEEVQKASHKFNKSLLAYTISMHKSSLGLHGGESMMSKVKEAALSNNTFLVDAFLQAHSMFGERIEKKDKGVFDDLPIRPKKNSDEISEQNLTALWAHLKKLRKHSLQYKMVCSKVGHKSLGQLDIPESINTSLQKIQDIFQKHKVDQDTFTNVIVDIIKEIPSMVKIFDQVLPTGMNLNTSVSEESIEKIRTYVGKYLFRNDEIKQ